MYYEKDFARIPQSIGCIELDGKRFLIFCPQEAANGKSFSPHASGWTLLPENALQNLSPLDLGFDFYSPRLFAADDKEILLIGQMCSTDSPYTGSVSSEDCFTVPRCLYTENSVLKQAPADFLKEKREYKRTLSLYGGEKADTFGVVFEAILSFSQSSFSFMLRDDILLECQEGTVSISFGKSGLGRKTRSFQVEDPSSVHIFSSPASVEIFIDGQVFTSRLSDSGLGGIKINIGSCRADIYKLKEF